MRTDSVLVAGRGQRGLGTQRQGEGEAAHSCQATAPQTSFRGWAGPRHPVPQCPGQTISQTPAGGEHRSWSGESMQLGGGEEEGTVRT